MFIVWGTKRVEKKLGWVSDYCPVCDDAHVHRLMEVRMVSHLYYIPLGRGESAGYIKQCHRCKNQSASNPRQYIHISKKKLGSLEEFTDATNPELVKQLASMLELREQAALGEVSEEKRRALLHQAFHFIIGPIAKRKQRINLDWVSSLWLITMIMGPIVLYFILISIPAMRMSNDVAYWISFGAFLVLVVGFTICVVGDSSRFIRRQYAREVIKRLAPLKPEEQELYEVLEALKTNPDTKAIGKAFKAGKLYDQINTFNENNTLTA